MRALEHSRQIERIRALHDLDILDTPREKDFDDIVELASRICGTPISVITLVDGDRQWFKAETGLGASGTPLESSICAHAILEPGTTIIPDTLEDRRTLDNPLCAGEPGLRFYAGALLENEAGLPLGTLCVLDHTPRNLDDTQRFAMEVLARQVVLHIKQRKQAADERRARILADERVAALERAEKARDILVAEVDHRVKNSLQMVASLLNIQSRKSSSADARLDLETARDRVQAFALLHEQLHVAADFDDVDMKTFLGRMSEHLGQTLPAGVSLGLAAGSVRLDTKRAGSIGIIVNELVANALKYAFPDGRRGHIEIGCSSLPDGMSFYVDDNGIGLPADFDMSATAGLGMRLIQSGVEQMDATLEVGRTGDGCRFTIHVPLDDQTRNKLRDRLAMMV